MKLKLKNNAGLVREVPVGLSFTGFFFTGFTLLCRGIFARGIIFLFFAYCYQAAVISMIFFLGFLGESGDIGSLLFIFLLIGCIPNLLFLLKVNKWTVRYWLDRGYLPNGEGWEKWAPKFGVSPDGGSSKSLHPQISNAPTTSPLVPAHDWIMRAKHTPFWKFLLGANPIKSYQLDYVEKKGDLLTVVVRSGKKCSFSIGEFNCNYVKKKGLRDFTFKSTVGPSQKVTFRETLLQMPEKWWDELELKVGASQSGRSKFLGRAEKLTDIFS